MWRIATHPCGGVGVNALDAGEMAIALDHLCESVRAADRVVAVGARTQWEVGGAIASGATEVRAPSGVFEYDPRDLTVTVAAGTPVRELAAVLAEHGQECPLDPRDPSATVGGVLATGLSGPRRLRHGPLRDRVLEVRFVTADGRLVKVGGPTVKNVTGFDLPRLLVGSLGTVGVITQVTLRCQPLPSAARWSTSPLAPAEVRRRLFQPSCIAWDGSTCAVLLEGVPDDLETAQRAIDAAPVDIAPEYPDGLHRGRVSVRPGATLALGERLDGIIGLRWLAEVGVGTVHVAADTEASLNEARNAAGSFGGWLLREAGAPGLDGFGIRSPNAALLERIRAAFDPSGKLGRGRFDGLCNPHPALQGEVSHA
jgi:glycolate oxidase FAD binding subunit